MSSMIRRMQRKAQRNSGSYQPRPALERPLPDGGYETLHPTRGWKRTSADRMLGQDQLAAIRTGG